MTDEQAEAIFDWATGGVRQLETFRDEQKNDTDNNDGKGVSKKAK